MELIGQYIKSHRIKQKLSLLAISKELNINKEILTSIESDNFPEFINYVYMIGHIKSYAKFLKLDQNEVIENFKIQNYYNKDIVKNEVTKPIPNNKLINFFIPLSYGSALFVAIGFYFLFIKPSNLIIDYAITPNVPENLSSELEAIEMNIALSKDSQKKIIKSDVIEIQDLYFDHENLSESLSASSVIASSPNKELITSEKVINLKFLNPTWVQLRDKKNNIILSRLMNQGDQHTYKLSQNFYLTAGNAGNIIVSFDGVVKGKAGKSGEVIDSLFIDENFKN